MVSYIWIRFERRRPPFFFWGGNMVHRSVTGREGGSFRGPRYHEKYPINRDVVDGFERMKLNNTKNHLIKKPLKEVTGYHYSNIRQQSKK